MKPHGYYKQQATHLDKLIGSSTGTYYYDFAVDLDALLEDICDNIYSEQEDNGHYSLFYVLDGVSRDDVDLMIEQMIIFNNNLLTPSP